GLSSAEYTVRLMAQPTEPGRTPRTASRNVGVTAGQETRIELRLAPGPSVTGHVMKGGAPVASAGVMLVPEDGPFAAQRGQTGDDGAFRFDDVQPGRYQLRSGNAVTTFAVDASPVTTDLTIPSAEVGGRVTDAQ